VHDKYHALLLFNIMNPCLPARLPKRSGGQARLALRGFASFYNYTLLQFCNPASRQGGLYEVNTLLNLFQWIVRRTFIIVKIHATKSKLNPVWGCIAHHHANVNKQELTQFVVHPKS